MPALQLPRTVTDCVCFLQTWMKEKLNLGQVLTMQTQMIDIGLGCYPFIGNYLISMLAEADGGSVYYAQQAFDRLSYHDNGSLHPLMKCYAKSEQPHRALSLYNSLAKGSSINVPRHTYVALLKACAVLKDMETGCTIHSQIESQGLSESEIFIASSLIDMYAKCGLMKKAKEVFDTLGVVRNVVTWNALIAGYVENEYGHKAISCYQEMQDQGLVPDSVTLMLCVKACALVQGIETGRVLHGCITRNGLDKDTVVGSTLVDMYAKCGALTEAQNVFEMASDRDIIIWSVLIAGYEKWGLFNDAINHFYQMQLCGIPPNEVTYTCILRGCSSVGALDEGLLIHSDIVKKGWMERSTVVGNALIDVYARFGMLQVAEGLFNALPDRDVLSWNTLISGYAEYGHDQETLSYFTKMKQNKISPDGFTYLCSLRSCINMIFTIKGQEIHAEVVKSGLEANPFIGSALIGLYAKAGMLGEAHYISDELPIQDEVSLTALISGYCDNGYCEEALKCYEGFFKDNIAPTTATYVCSLKSSANLVTIYKGLQIHSEVIKRGMEEEITVSSTLVDMYAKCGFLLEAHTVFDDLETRNIVSWTALITGYAQLGDIENVFTIFCMMLNNGIKPNAVTFSSVLTACSYIGHQCTVHLYLKCLNFDDYGFVPTLEHYTCTIDLFSRLGQIEKALELINKMPFQPGMVAWHAMLHGCQKWPNVDFGKYAFENVLGLDEGNITTYISLCNIYGAAFCHRHILTL